MSFQKFSKMMKAIKQSSFGGFEAYDFTSVPMPTMESNQILVKVFAAGINPMDTYVRQGVLSYKDTKLPLIPGKDFSGIVEKCGENAGDKFPIGTKVWGISNNFGAYAQYIVATPGADYIGTMSENMSYEQGASIGIPYMTAFDAIDAAQLKTGQTVVVHGASGGVGIGACNIASWKGCNVIATVSTLVGEQNAKKSGATAVFYHNKEGYVKEMMNYAQDNFGQIDAVIDNAAHININSDMEMVKPGGTIIVVGSRGSQETNIRMILAKHLTIKGVFLFSSGKEKLNSYISQIEKMSTEGQANPIFISFPAEEIATAQTEVITPSLGGAQGKVVITFT